MHKYKNGKSKPEWKIAITLLFGTNIKTEQERVRNGWGHPVGLTCLEVIRRQLPEETAGAWWGHCLDKGGLHLFHGTPEVETRISGWNVQGGRLVIKMEWAALGGNHGSLTSVAPT